MKSPLSLRWALATSLAIGGLAAAWQPAIANDTPSPAPSPAPVGQALTSARAAIDKKDWKAAIGQLEAAEKQDPRNADVENLLGYSWRNSGNLDKAFAHYKLALEIDPKHRGAHEYIGIAYLKAKQPDKAKEHLAQLEAICGKQCEETEDLANAIAAYKP